MQKLGIVIDNLDPDHLGRIKARILGVHTQKDSNNNYIIKDDDLPWYINGNMISTGNFHIPKLGDIVAIDIDDNYTGMYFENIYPNKELLEYFQNNDSDYQNASILLYDNCLGSDLDNNKPINYREDEYIKVYYFDSKGFCIDYKTKCGESHINIDSENNINISSGENKITIDLTSNKIEIKADNEITLDANKIKLGSNATNGILKSKEFINAFNMHTHPCPNGVSGPPEVGLDISILSDKIKGE